MGATACCTKEDKSLDYMEFSSEKASTSGMFYEEGSCPAQPAASREDKPPPVGHDFAEHMRAHGLSQLFIDMWISQYQRFCEGEQGLIPEAEVEPIQGLPTLDSLPAADTSLFEKTVVLKMNSMLGTDLGMDGARSLLKLSNDETLLDVALKQVLGLRRRHAIHFIMVNTSETDVDAKKVMSGYSDIDGEWASTVIQSMAPKINASTNKIAEKKSNPGCEWYYPGSAHVVTTLIESGKLDELLQKGFRYMFVSDSDNVGAILDARLLSHLDTSCAPMLMEVYERTEADAACSHLARSSSSGRLIVRELGQCPKPDEAQFRSISTHRFACSGNIWLNLPKIKDIVSDVKLAASLPFVASRTMLDPSDIYNPKPDVFQLQSTLASAVSVVPASAAVCVPSARVSQIRDCGELLLLQSDAYIISEDSPPVLATGSLGKPQIQLDPSYARIQDLQEMCPSGPPSLKCCKSLKITGKVVFSAGAACVGDVEIRHASRTPKEVQGNIKGIIDLEMMTPQTLCVNHQTSLTSFEVQLFRESKDTPVGLDLTFTDGKTLVVADVTGGLALEWNNSNPDLQIQPGDVIIAINSFNGDARKMIKRADVQGEIVLVIKRP